MNNLKDKILTEIQSGKVAMTPRSYFTLKFTFLVLIATTIVLVTVLLFNFISFAIRINDDQMLLSFGPRGLGAFLHFFPWHLLIIDIGLVVLLQWLLRRFHWGYKVPVLYLIGGLMFGALTLGLALDHGTPFNDRIREGRGHLPPPMRGFYEGGPKNHGKGSGMCRCTILAIENNILTVEDTRNATSTLTVILPENDRRATTSNLSVGDTVFIAGDEKDGVIHAFGVKKEDREFRNEFIRTQN